MIVSVQDGCKAPGRPVLQYHGGKWRLAPWIISQMPAHACYVEPFGGSASVLMQKARVAAECYNDLDGQVVNVFRVLQDPETADRLRRRLALTPFARAEFDRTYEPSTDAIDAACKTIARSFMGHGSDSATRSCRTGFRAKLSGGRALPAAEWAGWPGEVNGFIERLRGVVIESRDAAEIMSRFDSPDTLFYADPPYVHSSRSSLVGRGSGTHGYRHEMSDEDHHALAGVMKSLSGMVVLSGYRCDLYDTLFADWQRLDRITMADGARERTESLWLNGAAFARREQPGLWGVR